MFRIPPAKRRPELRGSWAVALQAEDTAGSGAGDAGSAAVLITACSAGREKKSQEQTKGSKMGKISKPQGSRATLFVVSEIQVGSPVSSCTLLAAVHMLHIGCQSLCTKSTNSDGLLPLPKWYETSYVCASCEDVTDFKQRSKELLLL